MDARHNNKLCRFGVLLHEPQQRAALLREAQTLNGNLVAAAQATLAPKAFAAGA